jgi:hypothetical protein
MMLDEVTCFHCDEARTYERPHAPDECNGIDWDAPSSEAKARFGDCVGKIDAAPQDRAYGEHVALQKRDRHERRDGVKGCLRTDVDETQQEREERSNVNCVDGRQVLWVDLKRQISNQASKSSLVGRHILCKSKVRMGDRCLWQMPTSREILR